MVGQTSPIVAITSTPAHERRNGPMTDRKPVSDAGADLAITLSVIISTYNAREVPADCLQSIYQNPPSEPYEIIVVDDASADGTSDMVRARFPEVRLLRNE